MAGTEAYCCHGPRVFASNYESSNNQRNKYYDVSGNDKFRVSRWRPEKKITKQN